MDMPLPLVLLGLIAVGQLSYRIGWTRGFIAGLEKARQAFGPRSSS